MGHYGCGGVAASIATPPPAPIDAANGAVQNWIAPIRAIFQSSTRPEIVELREKVKGQVVVEGPEPQDSGFRALVEWNVKASVRRVATDSVIASHFALLATRTNATARRVEADQLDDVFIQWGYQGPRCYRWTTRQGNSSSTIPCCWSHGVWSTNQTKVLTEAITILPVSVALLRSLPAIDKQHCFSWERASTNSGNYLRSYRSDSIVGGNETKVHPVSLISIEGTSAASVYTTIYSRVQAIRRHASEDCKKLRGVCSFPLALGVATPTETYHNFMIAQ